MEPGTRLGSYEIVADLGAGAMGDVYRAKDLKLGRDVALKVLRPELANEPDRLRRFEQEARAASALNHPNIVHIYDIGEEDGNHFIAMELVEGTTLRNLLVDAPFRGERLVEIGKQIAAGLAKAHEEGIVHRDLKPENVMVTADGYVKLLDFGLAKLTAEPFESHSETATIAQGGTRHGMLLGTVEYMSPEQAAGRPVDYRSDQFSFGLILYEMATGRIAFQRNTAAQTLASIIENEPEPMRGPRGLDAVVARCLAKKPDGRFTDTAEIVRLLKGIDLARPPIPPVPQNPKADEVPPLGSIGDYVERQVGSALSEVDRSLKRAFEGESRYQLRSSSGKMRSVSEKKLRKWLRRRRFSGLEMVRREGESVWLALHETALFRDEVGGGDDSLEEARRRKVMDFGQHATVFVAFGVAWFLFQGEVPFWMGFWGIGLAAHAFDTAPAMLGLMRGRRRLEAETRAEPEPQKALPEHLLSDGFRAEVQRVKELVERRGGDEAESLMRELDGIVERMTELGSRRSDLEEQTSADERARLERSLKEAEESLGRATSAGDRKLYQRQLEVLRQRGNAIDKALEVLRRIRVRQDVAENQIKQLRLDLSRGEAASASAPQLTSRLQDIRHEVDAAEAVDEAIAQELLS